MSQQSSRRRMVAGLLMLLAGSQAGLPVMARAQSSSRSGEGGADQSGDRNRLNDMERLRDQLRDTRDNAQRQRLLTRYREQINAAMGDLGQAPGPDPDASAAARLDQLEQREAIMQRLIRHMWSYQNELGRPDRE